MALRQLKPRKEDGWDGLIPGEDIEIRGQERLQVGFKDGETPRDFRLIPSHRDRGPRLFGQTPMLVAEHEQLVTKNGDLVLESRNLALKIRNLSP